MNNLRVTLVQTTLHWEDRRANLHSLRERLAGLAGRTDLIVLPEMFTTGFSMNAAALAEDMDGPTVAWLAARAAETGAVVTGSFIAREGGYYFNRLVWMRPDGACEYYDKRHLFTLAGEHQHYQAGRRRLSVELNGWKVRPLICYDLRFPVWSRNTDDYDLLLYVANWPDRRRQAWRSLLTARAIENQAYTIGVNRVGEDANGHLYSGDSSVVDYAGEILAHLAYHEQTLTVTLARDAQLAFRERLRFLADRDHFLIPETE